MEMEVALVATMAEATPHHFPKINPVDPTGGLTIKTSTYKM